MNPELEKVRSSILSVALFLLVVLLWPGSVAAAQEADDPAWEDDLLVDFEEPVADPLEPLNRFFFEVNDRLYFHLLQPLASNYARAVPAGIRNSVSRFFHNLLGPVRVVNNLLQAKPRESGVELSRFLINTTIGIAGLWDPARTRFGLEPRVEDFGQTLGYYGFGEGFYIVWPFLGPSNLRDSVGRVGDSFLSPVDHLILRRPVVGLSVATFEAVNEVSFRLGEYEQLQEMAFDPYLAVRDAYQQRRRTLIGERLKTQEPPTPFEGELY